LRPGVNSAAPDGSEKANPAKADAFSDADFRQQVLVFISSRQFAFLRDRLLRLISMQQVIGPVMKQLTELI
jgi:hypothetical protein